ncbi:hypothetical protein N665_0791s0004 [Sinapis alba]|nr:hypothetical protein N665_0791s0004 [Sinapis alba]
MGLDLPNHPRPYSIKPRPGPQMVGPPLTFPVGTITAPDPGPMTRTQTLRLAEVRRDHPLSLSISLSGGKETNKDSLSNGEQTGKSPA